MIISVVGPGVCGRTLLTYLLAKRLMDRSSWSILLVDTDPRLKKSSLEVLLLELRNEYGLYSYDGSGPLPIVPVSERLFLVPPGRFSKYSIDVARNLLNIVEKAQCDIALIDCSIPDSPLLRYVLANSHIIVNIKLVESYLDLSYIVKAVDPKPKIINIVNMVRKVSKNSNMIEIPYISKLWGNINNVKKVNSKSRLVKHVDTIVNRLLIYVSNLEHVLNIARRILLEELLVW